jgi:hypothetical protein
MVVFDYQKIRLPGLLDVRHIIAATDGGGLRLDRRSNATSSACKRRVSGVSIYRE